MKQWLDKLSERQERTLLSALAALAFGLLMFFSIRDSFPEELSAAAAAGAALLSAALIFCISFIVLSVSSRKLKTRKEEREDQTDGE